MKNRPNTLEKERKMKFGEKLRHHRKRAKMTQAQLAEKAGISLKTVINYEGGSTYPQNREIYTTLGEILNVDPNYLYNENDDFVAAASAKYGYKGKRQAEELVADVAGLFAGGELSERDKDAVMKALQKAYWDCKETNIEKYTPKTLKNEQE